MSIDTRISIVDATTGESAIVNNGALDTNKSNQYSSQISLYLGQSLAEDVTIRTNSAVNDTIIYITSPTVVPVANNYILIKEGVRFTQSRITLVTNPSGNDYNVTVNMPNDFGYTTGATVCIQNCNMNVNGSVTPISFSVSPKFLDEDNTWHITRMIVAMTHSSAGDDGLFGGITKLTNGIYFRIQDGSEYNLFNVRENSDLAAEGFDLVYSTRSSPGEVYGTRSRISFNGDDKRGVVIPLYSSDSDELIGTVRDDLTSLTSFKIRIQGHVVD